MKFNDHHKLEGAHAFLGASKHAWLRYSDDKLHQSYINSQATVMGTRLHAFAAECIRLGQKLPRSKRTICLYVNDAITYGMTPEQILYHSDNCFGTADAISFRGNELRIHDLKTGSNTASMEQLEIYAAMFCDEYHVSPKDIFIELRIYQNNEVFVENPDPNKILEIITLMRHFDKLINTWKEAEL